MRAARLVLLVWLLVAPGCGDDGAAAPDRDLQRDVKALQDLMAQDPTIGILAEIDREVDEDRPVHASEMIGSAGLPAARRQLASTEAVATKTAQGRTLRGRLV